MGEAACRGPRERHSPGPNLALNGPGRKSQKQTLESLTRVPNSGTPAFCTAMLYALQVFNACSQCTNCTEVNCSSPTGV